MDGKEKSAIWILITVILLTFAGWMVWKYHYSAAVSIERKTEPEVHVLPIAEQKVTLEKKYIGYVMPINDVDVRPYISGFIDKVYVNGGKTVSKGEKLLTIEASEYEAALKAAKALELKATADWNYAETYYRRVQKAGTKAVAPSEIDNAKARFLAAKASLENAKAAVAGAEVNLKYTVISATISGIIGNVALTSGDYVSPQSRLLSIIQTTPIRVVFSISDKDYLEEVQKESMFSDEKIRLKLADGSIYPFLGAFRYTDNKIDRSTNAVAVYADFENPQNLLIDNAYVTVLIEKQYDGVLVEKDRVYLQPDGSFIYVEEDGFIKKHQIKILAEYGDNYVLKNDFSSQMRLVKEKVNFRNDNQKVKIISDSSHFLKEKS